MGQAKTGSSILLLATVLACDAPADVELSQLVGTWEATELVFHDLGRGQRVDRVETSGAGLTMTIGGDGGTTWILRPGNGFFSILTGNLELLAGHFFLRFDPAGEPATGIIALENGHLLMQFDAETTTATGVESTLQLLFAFRRP